MKAVLDAIRAHEIAAHLNVSTANGRLRALGQADWEAR